jgi:hypothetical protein
MNLCAGCIRGVDGAGFEAPEAHRSSRSCTSDESASCRASDRQRSSASMVSLLQDREPDTLIR